MIELIEFGPTRNLLGGTKKPSVTISRSGSVTINRQAMELMKLSKGDQVLVCQNAKSKKLWYLKKTTTGGFTLRKTYKEADDGYGLFMSKNLTEKILVSLNQSKTMRLQVIEKVMEGDLWALDTSAL